MSNEYYDVNATEDDGSWRGLVRDHHTFPAKTPASEDTYAIVDKPTINYKFRERELIEEFQKYIDSTYSQHYSLEKFQALEFIFDGGHGEGFNVGNVLKYAQRYGKKGSRADARKDMTKVLHYALLQLFLHDEETKRLAMQDAGYSVK
jgi:hypothetical protein